MAIGAAFDRFKEGRLELARGELGERAFQSPPDVKEFPVHHISHGAPVARA